MRKCPSSPVREACGPPQISLENLPIVYTLTFSPYFDVNRPTAPCALASSTVISSQTTGTSAAIASLTSFSTARTSSSVMARPNVKSNRKRSSVMFEPFWLTFSSFNTVLSARWSKCVAVCSLAVATVLSAKPPPVKHKPCKVSLIFYYSKGFEQTDEAYRVINTYEKNII